MRMLATDLFGIVGTTVLGNVEVKHVVAEGGFAVVYQAQHLGFRAPVALKCLKVPENMTPAERERYLESFRAEAELVFRLSASISEVVRPLHHDVLYLADGRMVPSAVFEWLEGESLDQIIERRNQEGRAPLSLHKLLRLMRPVAVALSRAHRFPGPNGTQCVIHRDIKPENIFVARSADAVETVKLLDFGIAKVASRASWKQELVAPMDHDGAFTPAYGAPEQWQPRRFGPTGPYTDVWGLAITMVEALLGRPPITGDQTTMMATALDERRRPTPRALGVILPSEVEGIFEKALRVNPRDRIQDVELFWTEIENAVGLVPSFRPRDLRRESLSPEAIEPEHISLPGSSVAARSPSPIPLRSPLPSDFPPSKPVAESTVEGPTEGASPIPKTLPPGGGHVRTQAFQSLPALEPLSRSTETPPPPRPAEAPPLLTAFEPVAGFGDPLVDSNLDFEVEPKSVIQRTQPSERVRAPFSEPPASVPRADVAPLSHQYTNGAPLPVRSYPPGPRRFSARGPSAADELRRNLRLPIGLLAVALSVTSLDLVVSRLTGDLLAIGPVRPLWVSGPFAVIGFVLVVWRVFSESNND